jgi:hypothetical protein
MHSSNMDGMACCCGVHQSSSWRRHCMRLLYNASVRADVCMHSYHDVCKMMAHWCLSHAKQQLRLAQNLHPSLLEAHQRVPLHTRSAAGRTVNAYVAATCVAVSSCIACVRVCLWSCARDSSTVMLAHHESRAQSLCASSGTCGLWFCMCQRPAAVCVDAACHAAQGFSAPRCMAPATVCVLRLYGLMFKQNCMLVTSTAAAQTESTCTTPCAVPVHHQACGWH